jgi:hypothetical protein
LRTRDQIEIEELSRRIHFKETMVPIGQFS